MHNESSLLLDGQEHKAIGDWNDSILDHTLFNAFNNSADAPKNKLTMPSNKPASHMQPHHTVTQQPNCSSTNQAPPPWAVMHSREHKKLLADYTDKIAPEGIHELPVRNDWDPITSKSSPLSNLHSDKHFAENELTQRFLLNL
ncbi:hypothetical protein, partial [Salmonella sp. s51228]|uniref:hypothetical protein n=1 Tax=Salmonella sp. s51228 TaxID=3159652 RepID=UPI003980CBA3